MNKSLRNNSISNNSENSSINNIFQVELDKLIEEKKFYEIEKKKQKNLSNNIDIINNFKHLENSDLTHFINLKINYLNKIENFIKDSNPNFLKEISQKKNFFYNLMEKKAAKIITVYKNNFKEMNIKNLIINMINFNLFLLYLQNNFKIDISKFIIKNMNEVIYSNMRHQNFQNLRKIGILLSGDNWKRIALQDDHE